jgi:hypothetical protein
MFRYLVSALLAVLVGCGSGEPVTSPSFSEVSVLAGATPRFTWTCAKSVGCTVDASTSSGAVQYHFTALWPVGRDSTASLTQDWGTSPVFHFAPGSASSAWVSLAVYSSTFELTSIACGIKPKQGRGTCG